MTDGGGNRPPALFINDKKLPKEGIMVTRESCSVHPDEFLREDGSCLKCADATAFTERLAAVAKQAASEFATLQKAILERCEVAGKAEDDAEKIAKDEIIPYILRMREILSKQGHRTDLGQPKGLTFIKWFKLNKKALGSQAGFYRRLKKAKVLPSNPTQFEVGERLQEKEAHGPAAPICKVTYLHPAEEDGSQEVDVIFENGDTRTIDVPLVGRFKAPKLELHGLYTLEGGAEYKYEGREAIAVFTRTTTPTPAEVAQAAALKAALQADADAAAKVAADAAAATSNIANQELEGLAGGPNDASRKPKSIGTKGKGGRPSNAAKAEKARLAALAAKPGEVSIKDPVTGETPPHAVTHGAPGLGSEPAHTPDPEPDVEPSTTEENAVSL